MPFPFVATTDGTLETHHSSKLISGDTQLRRFRRRQTVLYLYLPVVADSRIPSGFSVHPEVFFWGPRSILSAVLAEASKDGGKDWFGGVIIRKPSPRRLLI